MDFARQQRSPTKHLLGLTFVTLLHVGVVYLLMSGLGRHAIQVIQKPLNMKIVEEIKVTPPPEPPKPPPPKEPPPKTAPPPPPAYVPPPEVKVDVAPPPATITVQTMEKPPEAPAPIVREPVVEAPAPAPAPPAPPPAPKPAVRRGAAIVLNKEECKPEFPRKAQQEGIIGEGEALIDVAADGSATKVVITAANPRGVFDREVIKAFMRCRFPADTSEYKVTYPFGFKMEE